MSIIQFIMFILLLAFLIGFATSIIINIFGRGIA